MVTDERWPAALACLRQGRLEDAAGICRQIVREAPQRADVWQLLGVIDLRSGAPERAVESLEQSLRLEPAQPVALTNLGAALRASGRAAEAVRSCDQALVLEPGLVEALNNRASSLLDLGRHAEALASCERALECRPDYAEALNNRGNALRALGRAAQALASFSRALELRPRFAPAYSNRAAALLDLKRAGPALDDCERALEIDPFHAEAHNNRGTALCQLERWSEALASFARALELQPSYADALVNRGHALQRLGRAQEALENLERALALKPDFALALSARAELLAGLGRHQEAARCAAELLRVAPDFPFAAGLLLHCRLQDCDWTDYAECVPRLLAQVEAGARVVAPFWCLALTDSAQLQQRCARTFADDQRRADISALPPAARVPHSRIRVAYLSADFREHPLSRLLAGVLEQHDRERFEVSAVSLGGPEGSALGRRVAAAFSRFEDVSRASDQQAAELVRKLEIDILVDLLGYTQGLRPGILARRPAPIQVSYLGYPGTLAADYIDYIIGDEFVIPATAEQHYSEQVVRLACSFQANDAQREARGAPTRVLAGLPERGLVLCCFNTSYKLAPPVFDIWMRLLRACEGSVLWVVAGSEGARRNLVTEAARRGVASQRIVFAARLPYPEHLARLRLADLYLDTFPFNGGASASDALWAGLPVLTCAGDAFAARMAGSLLRALQLPELITDGLAQYERVGCELLATPAKLADLRTRLGRARSESALFDTSATCRQLELAYLRMWARYQRP